MASKKNNPFKALQREVEKWIEIRKKTANFSQELVNLINRLTFMSNDKVHNAFGDALMPSRLSAMLRDEISDKSSKLHSLQDDMMRCLKQIAILMPSVFPIASSSSKNKENVIIASSSSSCLVEQQTFSNMLNQMQQQTLLEMCIVEELFGPSESDEDDDDDDDEDYNYNDKNMQNSQNHSNNNNNNNSNNESEIRGTNRGKNRINNRTNISGDQDAAVTMLACFTYPPYLRISELESFIDLK